MLEKLKSFEEFEEEEKSSSEIDVDKIAKEYAEEVRDYLRDLKNQKADIHFESINPDELTYGDLMMADKFRKEILTEEEFEKYREQLQSYVDSAKKEAGDEFDALEDSRVNLSAWILNKMIVSEFKKRHPEAESQK